MKYLKVKEAAERLGVPEGTLRYWVHIGYGPPSARFGRRRVFSEELCDAWIEQQFAADQAQRPGVA